MQCAICNNEDRQVTEYLNQLVCTSCKQEIEAYASRIEARHQRLVDAAAHVRSEATATQARAGEMASRIPFGQPILIGHHSEKRDRAYRERIERLFRKSFEHFKRAKDLQRRADAAATNTAIRSDDPAALVKLKDELVRLERLQKNMIDANRLIRKLAKTDLDTAEKARQVAAIVGITEAEAATLFKPDYMGRTGYADFATKNNAANIRRVKSRIDDTTKRQQVKNASAGPTRTTHGEIIVERDPEDNRLRIIFPDKPGHDVIALLRQRGFVWSRANGAWQRQLNNAAEFAAQQIIQTISK